MNTTMVDGAEQRLDAQIAEALFGQPGMSKMDVANRVRELRGDGPPLLVPRKAGQNAMVPHARALELVGDPPRYVVLKASGSRFAYVNDTHERRTVTRWDILKSNGWDKAELQCKRLNEEHERGQTHG